MSKKKETDAADSRDNNSRRGRDRYGSRQAVEGNEDDMIDAGFRDSGRSEFSVSGEPSGKARNAAAARSGTGGSGIIYKIAVKLNINAFSVPAYFIKYILAVSLSFSIIYAVVKTSGLTAAPLAVFVACAAFAAFFSILFLNIFVANGVILGGIAVFLVYVYNLHNTGRLEDYRIVVSYFLRRFTYWAGSFFYMGQPHNERYELILFTFVCALVCLFVYFITIKRFRFPFMFAAGFATFCIQWCYGFYAGALPLVIFIGVTVIGYIWHIYLKNNSQFGGWTALMNPVRFLKPMTPFLLFMILCISISPVPDKPIQWQWLYDIYNGVAGRYNDRFYYYRVDNFALNTTGFSSGESFLSGPVRLNNTHVLSVITDDPALYLKGNGKEIYTGNSWKNPPYIYWQATPPPSPMPSSSPAPTRRLTPSPAAGGELSATRGNTPAAKSGTGVIRPTAQSGPAGDSDSDSDGSSSASESDREQSRLRIYVQNSIITTEPSKPSTLVEPAEPDRDGGGEGEGELNWLYGAELSPINWTIGAPSGINPGNARQPDEISSRSYVDRSSPTDASYDLNALFAEVEDEAAAAAEDIELGIAEPRSVRAKYRAIPTAEPGLNESGRPKSVTDLDSPELTDVRDMEEALARLDSGAPERIPGPLYYGGGTEVDLDVSEYAQNNMLYLFRLMAGGSNESLIRLGVNGDSLGRSGRWMLNRDIARATVFYNRMKTFSLFTSSKMINIQNINMDVGSIYEEGGALTLEHIMTEGFSYGLEYYPETRQEAASQLMLLNSYRGLYGDLLDDYDSTVVVRYSSGFEDDSSDFEDDSSGGEGDSSGGGEKVVSGVINLEDSPVSIDLESGTDAAAQLSGSRRGTGRNSGSSGVYLLRVGDYIERDLLNRLVRRAEDIRRRYTDLPETLPERVWILTERLTEGAETDYEKALILEDFLYNNYTYSLNVGYLPKGEDFVDNFLFTQSEGYCTHFASALAVMARCAGIPSRYVEGYTMPAEIGEDGVYKVTNTEAHAWVEIYFEGYGWKRFEPTATYQERFKQQIYYPSGGYGDSQYSGAMDYYDRYMEEMMREQNYFGYAGAFDVTSVNNNGQRAEIIAAAVRTGLVVIAVLLPIGVIAFGRRRAGKRFSAFSAEPGQAVRSMYKHYLKILKKLNCKIEQGETLAQFADRVDGSLRIRKSGLTSAIDVFEKLIYSRHEITGDDRQAVRDVYPQLLTAYSIRKNKFTFFIMKDLIAEI